MLYLGCTWTLQNKQCMPGFKFFKCSGSDICHKLNAHSWELNNTYLSALPPDLIQTLTTQLRNKTFANPNDTTMQKTCTRPGKLERPDFFFACHVCRAPDRDFALTVEIPRNYNRSFHLKTRTAFHTTRAFQKKHFRIQTGLAYGIHCSTLVFRLHNLFARRARVARIYTGNLFARRARVARICFEPRIPKLHSHPYIGFIL